MTWLVALYVTAAYGYFRATLACCCDWDTPGTVVLNSAIALAIGPIIWLGMHALAGWIAIREHG